MPRLPEPVLARTYAIPRGNAWLFEPKLDGFRCRACTDAGRLRVRSRRGCDITELLPELRSLPADVQLDGEIVALNANGVCDFQWFSAWLLHKRGGISVVSLVFDVLAVEGLARTMLPYSKRRQLLEELEVKGSAVEAGRDFRGRHALFDAVCARGPGRSVREASRRSIPPDEQLWVKTKNRATAQFAEERDGIGRRARRRRSRRDRPPSSRAELVGRQPELA